MAIIYGDNYGDSLINFEPAGPEVSGRAAGADGIVAARWRARVDPWPNPRAAAQCCVQRAFNVPKRAEGAELWASQRRTVALLSGRKSPSCEGPRHADSAGEGATLASHAKRDIHGQRNRPLRVIESYFEFGFDRANPRAQPATFGISPPGCAVTLLDLSARLIVALVSRRSSLPGAALAGRRWRGHALGLVLAIAIAGAAHAADAPAADSYFHRLEIGGSVELAYERQQNFDLDRATDDDVDLLPVELQLEILFEPNDYFQAYIQPQLTRQFVLREQGADEDRGTELVIEEAYVKVADPERGLSLQVGRQTFEDDRQWLYDAELDAVRGTYRAANLAIELSVSRKALVRENLLNSISDEPVNNYIIYGAYELIDAVIVGAYGVASDHRSSSDRPIFLGLFSVGTIGDRLTYWLDGALVRGRESDRNLRGWGIDVLSTYRIDAPLSPYVILGYAFGSGDSDPDDARDGAFR